MCHINNINCKHKDNWDYCRIRKMPRLFRWLTPKGRKLCVFKNNELPQDGILECEEQEKHPKPPAPKPQ